MKEKPGLIVALDVGGLEEVDALRATLAGLPVMLKVGLRLFTAFGPEAVRRAAADGHPVFLDLKLHDIPNTVAGAVESAAGLGVYALSVHLAGGRRMLERAAAVADRPKLWGITVLTSLVEEDLRPVTNYGPAELVDRLGHEYAETVDGFVCSGEEVSRLRAIGEDLDLVVPGVRPAGSEKGDQRRVVTPAQLAERGATHAVVGRPVLEAEDRRATAVKILKELGHDVE